MGPTFVAVLTGLICLTSLDFAAYAATTERVVLNRHTGLAIEGFDPVAYFTDGGPLKGRPEVEASVDGAIWRFRNDRNRAFFIARPEVYGPQFGGYDPVDVALGKAVSGDARLWLVTGQRLYLFGREAIRDEFAADPARFLTDATRRWPELRETLSP